MYALLVYYFTQQRKFSQAHSYIEDMRARGILIDPFIEPDIIEQVYTYVVTTVLACVPA